VVCQERGFEDLAPGAAILPGGAHFSRDTVRDRESALLLTQEREACEARRYRDYYGIDIRDLAPYHIVLNSEKFAAEDLMAIVDTAIRVIEEKKQDQ